MKTTLVIQKAREGDRDAKAELFVRTHDTLKRIAHSERNKWHGNLTMNATALIQEAYLKLVESERLSINDRSHFLAVAGKAMRQVIQDYAASKGTAKRGGDVEKISLDLVEGVGSDEGPTNWDTLIDINTALEKLDAVYPELSNIVECRFYGGMTIEETATALQIGTTTVTRRWALAQSMLFKMMQEG